MRFGDLLNILLNLINSSISDLSQYLEYDRSYISKWVNNRELPSEKKWDEILQLLVSYFEERTSEIDITRLILQYPVLKKSISNEDMAKKFEELLEDSYRYSLKISQYQGDDSYNNLVKFLKGDSEVYDYLFNIITNDLYRFDESTDLYSSADLLRLFIKKDLYGSNMGLISPNYINFKFNSDFYRSEDVDFTLEYLNEYFKFILLCHH